MTLSGAVRAPEGDGSRTQLLPFSPSRQAITSSSPRTASSTVMTGRASKTNAGSIEQSLRAVMTLAQPDPLHQLTESWIEAQRRVAGVDVQVDEPGRTELERPLEALEGAVDIAHRGMAHRHDLGSHVVLPGLLLQPGEDLVGFLAPSQRC